MIYGGSGYPNADKTPADKLAEACRQKAQTLRKWGVGASRMGICWCNVEKVRGQYDWSEPDAELPAVAGAGINIVLCVATTPQWAWQHPEAERILVQRGQANLAGCLPHKPEYWPDYERYLTEVVKRYGKHVRHYELWNEPDGMAGLRLRTDESGNLLDVHYGGDPAWYAELVKRSYKIIKSIQPEARVGIGSFENKDPANPESTRFFTELYQHGIKGHFDAVSIHPYGNPFRREWLGACRQIMVEHGDGDKPMWITEYSMHERGIGLAFNTRRQLRLLRETPWISMAQPLVFEAHFDTKISPQQWSLRAHKQMSEEYAPRDEFVASFEGSILKLMANWEWLASGPNAAEPQISSDYPHSGDACLVAKTDDKTIRIWFTPYVKAKDAVFSGYLLVESKEKDPKLMVSVGVESGDILQPIREVRPWRVDWPTGKWEPFVFPIHEQFPEWKDLSVVTCYLEIQSDKMGLTVSIDDVRVGRPTTAQHR